MSWWLADTDTGKKRNWLIQVVHQLGLRSCYWSKPDDASYNERYAWRILEDVMAVAAQRLQADDRFYPAVGAMIDAQNGRALAFFTRFGFQQLSPGTVGYLRLYYPLRR